MAIRYDIEIPAGYRVLEDYEKVKIGDKVLYSPKSSSTPVVDVVNGHIYIGMSQNLLCGTAVRPSEKSEWINKNDRMPTEEDYKSGNYHIQVWLPVQNQPLHLTKAGVNEGGYNFTYWRPVPPPPKPVEKPIIIKESGGRQHGVVFHKDGSLVVGCTEISSELFGQIAKRRQEKMK